MVAIFVDYENIRVGLWRHFQTRIPQDIPVEKLCDAFKQVADEIGSLYEAQIFGDWTVRSEDARVIEKTPQFRAQLELLLLTLYMAEPQTMVKCSPTFKPQTVISMSRLKDRLNDAGFGGIWAAELGYIITLGYAKAVFLSADESANVVGHTAQILLEIDESQDVGKGKYAKDFKPMGATTNVTTVHYGKWILV